jgi:hypothetical protein
MSIVSRLITIINIWVIIRRLLTTWTPTMCNVSVVISQLLLYRTSNQYNILNK